MVEHSEAPKNPQNPTEKSDSEYQPLWDMDQPAPRILGFASSRNAGSRTDRGYSRAGEGGPGNTEGSFCIRACCPIGSCST